MPGPPTRGARGSRPSWVGWVLGLLATGLLAVCLSLLLTRSSARAAGQTTFPSLHVIPFPRTPDASPESEVIFSSLRPSDFETNPQVTGSLSGQHPGRLVALPDSAGTAFAPTRSFTPGETVRVRASLISSRAGAASGDRGATGLSFSFTVAAPAPAQGAAAGGPGAPAAARATVVSSASPAFRSAPGLDPPPVQVSTGPAPGRRDIFLSPSGQPRGFMILNPRGQLVWFRTLGGLLPANLEAQRYHGRPVLTWWQGTVEDGHGTAGEDVILNSSYQRVATVHPGWGYASDQHEFQITPQGTALLDAFASVRANLSGVGGPVDGSVEDCLVQEVDIHTGAVLWEWHALGHVPLSESYGRPPASGVYDPFHLNSIQQLPDHRLLMSFRNTSAVYEIDELTGHVIWTLGGKQSSFTMPRDTRFEWQHDAHLYGHGLLTLFDDASSPQEEPQSSAKELRIDSQAHRVSLVHRYPHSPPLLASSQGSAQLLNDHDVFVGWGGEPDFSEYTARGRQVFNASFALTDDSYRAYRFAWTGNPLTRPAVALARSANGTTRVYVSWNGATRVARWRVVGGSSDQMLRALKTKLWSGFETSIALPSVPQFLAVQALDAGGHVLGRSVTVDRGAA